MPKSYRPLVLLLLAWLVGWQVYSWPAMQDDALIHLRYADHLLHQHMVSYDGVHHSFGASSLLYITLLAVLRGLITTSSLLPRGVSTVAHVLLFGALAVGFARSLRRAPGYVWGFALVLLAALATSSSVRWLDDGMETPIVMGFAAALAFGVVKASNSGEFSGRAFAGLAVLGFFTVLLRVELLMLLGIASLMLLLSRMALEGAERGVLRLAVKCFAPLLGGLVAAGFIVAAMHSLLPDTALAKAFGIGAWHGTLVMTATIFASSMAFGVVSLVLWLLTAAAVLLVRRRGTLVALLANSPFPLVLFLATVRGQAVQGIRYFEWTFVFSILWNILELAKATDEATQGTARMLRVANYALVVALLVSVPMEAQLFPRVFRERETVLAELRSEHLERLAGQQIVAFDVGYIGYFTQSPLCDMAGLVNGRAAAVQPYSPRLQHCADLNPQYAFVNQNQAADLNTKIDLTDWSICAEYNLANLRSADIHYLVASPVLVGEVCGLTKATPKPFGPLLLPPSDRSMFTRPGPMPPTP